jgi:hypothetical protein
MRKQTVSLAWLAPAEDWDFRSVTEAECRVACYWEYARDMRPLAVVGPLPRRLVSSEDGPVAGPSAIVAAGWVRKDPVTKSPLFPKPWSSLTASERADVIRALEPFRALWVRTLEETVERAKWALVEDTPQASRYRKGAYVIRPNFSVFGVEAVIKELKAWARREAKKYRRSPRAKAAEQPFDLLKWLAVYRLEEKRLGAKITYEVAQESLREYREKNGRLDPNAVFPAYAAHGAWSKARSDAARIRRKVSLDQAFLLRDWYAIG